MQRSEIELETILRCAGYEPDANLAEHLDVFLRCMDKYVERSASYQEVWRQYGAMSNLLNAARKVDRMMASWWFEDGSTPIMHKDNLDDAEDGINYLVFFMRNAAHGNIIGDHPERPGG